MSDDLNEELLKSLGAGDITDVKGLGVKTYSEIKDVQHRAVYWCAYCGEHGDHQSGWCPRIKHDTQDQRPRLSPSLAHVKAMGEEASTHQSPAP